MLTVLTILSVATLILAIISLATDKVPTKAVVLLLSIICVLLAAVPLK